MIRLTGKIISVTMVLLIGAITLSACNGGTEQPPPDLPQITDETTSPDPVEVTDDMLPPLDGTNLEQLRDTPINTLQLTPLTPGEELAVMHTNMGDITLRLFPSEAPLAVENFITHAKDGYYDGVIFHRVIENFMIQGGDPTGTGGGGQSIWGHSFGVETSFNVHHFRGALAMAHAGGAMGSQFYIVHDPEVGGGLDQEMERLLATQDEPMGILEDGHRIYIRDFLPAEVLTHFLENGGTPFLDWHFNQQGLPHTVFGHVVEGMDVVDAIAATEVNASDRPLEDVIIESISFITYGE